MAGAGEPFEKENPEVFSTRTSSTVLCMYKDYIQTQAPVKAVVTLAMHARQGLYRFGGIPVELTY
jgi:hypothetical protein